MNLLPDDLGRLISAFKDRDAECVQILERIDQLTGRATEDTESNNVFRKVEKLAKDLDDATKEKLRLVMAMKEMIELKFDTVNKAFKSTEMNSSSERRDDTPTSDAHNELSTPSSSEVQKSTVKSKRGRKAKQALFADEDDEDYSSPADESSMMSNLSLLAQVALSNASPVPVKVARKTSKIPVVQHAGSSKPESSKPGSSVFEEMSDASDMDDEDESVNEPLYCLCHSISHGRMVSIRCCLSAHSLKFCYYAGQVRLREVQTRVVPL